MTTYRKITHLLFARIFSVMVCVLFAPALLNATDLNTWEKEGGSSSWNVLDGGRSVLQTINGDPTVFFDSTATSSQNMVLSGKIKVTTSDDNDAVGFVLGYKAGDILKNSAATTDFFIVDWRQGTQDNGLAGIAISHVSNVSRWFPDFWSHTGGVTEIQRGKNLGFTGWQDAVEYSFNIHFTSSLITVEVEGVEELRITPADVTMIGAGGSFSDGSFGFYNFSQSHVLYSSITTTDCNANPNAEGCGTLANNCDLALAVDVVASNTTADPLFVPSCDITGRPTRLTFKYIGGGCSEPQGANGQPEAQCSEQNDGISDGVSVAAVGGRNGHHDHLSHNHANSNEYMVSPSPNENTDIYVIGDSFTLSVDSTCEERFEEKTHITLTNEAGTGTETNIIHTSCRKKLVVGDVFGSLELEAINGMVAAVNPEYTYNYIVTNESTSNDVDSNGNVIGTSPIKVESVTVTDSVFGIIEPVKTELGGNIDSTDSNVAIFSYTTEVEIAVGDIDASVTADLNGMQDCSDSTVGTDSDNDSILDIDDNCIFIANTDQKDADGDGVGDLCEPTIYIYDSDNDGFSDLVDNCPLIANPDQKDSNGNGIGDSCDGSAPKPFGCNASKGNYDLLMLLMLILAFSYAQTVRASRRS